MKENHLRVRTAAVLVNVRIVNERYKEMMLIKNGTVIDPANNMEQLADVLVKDGKVVKVADRIGEAVVQEFNSGCDAGCKVIDASGCIVAPGLVDVHVHFRDPGFTYKEDIETGAKAALKG